MQICEHCFDSKSVSNFIINTAVKLSVPILCNECHSISEYRLESMFLKDQVQKIILKHYEYSEDLLISAALYAKEEDDDISLFVSDEIRYNLYEIIYSLFGLDDENFINLITCSSWDDYSIFDNAEDNMWINMKCDWEATTRIMLDWDKFCDNAKSQDEIDKAIYNFTTELLKLNYTIATLSKPISKILYRARNANKESTYNDIMEEPAIKLGIAPKESAKHNRFSPGGVPFVYLSDDDNTILKEIRAIENDRVGVARFKISDLNLIDLRKENLQMIKDDPFDNTCTDELLCSFKFLYAFLEDISKKVDDSDEEEKYFHYLPTQKVSNHIKSLGYDGFIYNSSLCDGINYLLFNDNYEYLDYKMIKVNIN